MNTIIINNVEYTKEDIIKDNELKKQLLEQLKREQLLEQRRIYSRQYRKDNKEKVQQYSREYLKNRYNNDENYRLKVLEKLKNKRIEQGFMPKPKGRPQKYYLDSDTLNLAVIV
jgi:hypothetical protein